MVRAKEDNLIYSRASAVMTEGILGDEMIKYLFSRNTLWMEEILWLVDWDAMGIYMNSGGYTGCQYCQICT